MKKINNNKTVLILSTFVMAIGLMIALQLVKERQVTENQAAANICRDNNASCEWNNQGNGISYQFEIVDMSNGFTIKQGNVQTNKVVFTTLTNHKYRCTVAAVNNCGKGASFSLEKLCSVDLPTDTPAPIPTLTPSPTQIPTFTPTPTIERRGGVPTSVPTEVLESPYPTLDWNFDPGIENESTTTASLSSPLKEEQIISSNSATVSSPVKKEIIKESSKANFDIKFWTKILSWISVVFVLGIILFGVWKKIKQS